MLRCESKQLAILFFFLQKLNLVNLVRSHSIDDLCKSVLIADYKFFESPLKDNPVKVYNRFDVVDIGEIDEEKMDYLLHVFMVTMWKDPRIKFGDPLADTEIPLFLPKECLQYLWQPDIFFETAKHVELFTSTAPAIILKVYSDGKVAVVKRYLFRSSCNMEFRNYPFDTQRCEFFVALISPDTEAILCWINEEGSPLTKMPVINLFRSIDPLQYHLGAVKTRKIVDILPDANYTTLVAEFVFYRRLIGSVINTFIPSTLIVLMSFIGFWLSVEVVPARVALSVTSLLTLCTQSHQYQSQLPPVNYIKAMDIWLFVCISLVFSTLLEFAICYNLHMKKIKDQADAENQVRLESKESKDSRISRNTRRKDQLFRRKSSASSNTDSCYFTSYVKVLSGLQHLWRKLSSQNADQLSQKLYPCFFIIFAIAYWTYYIRIYYDHV